MRSLPLAAALLATLAGQAALAQEVDRSAARAACRPDYKRLCADVPRGDGRIAACLRANVDRLSAACRPHVEAAIRREQQSR